MGTGDGVLLGIDGGASKTAGAALSPEGRVLGRVQLGGSAIVGAPRRETCEVLEAAVSALCEQAGCSRDQVVHCGIGLNGVDFADELPMQHAAIARAVKIEPDRVTLVNDGIVALWGATAARQAAIIQHGSGFTAAWRSDYGRETPYDHLAVARTFDMRQGLVALVARMLNGQVEPSPLKDKALAFFGVDGEAYCEAIYRDRISGERRRATVPLIFSSWLEGDAGAASLVERAIEDYALAAKAMVHKTGSPQAEVALGGGVLTQAPPRFRELLAARLRDDCPEATVVQPRLAPELGAAAMAGHRAGIDARDVYRGLGADAG